MHHLTLQSLVWACLLHSTALFKHGRKVVLRVDRKLSDKLSMRVCKRGFASSQVAQCTTTWMASDGRTYPQPLIELLGSLPHDATLVLVSNPAALCDRPLASTTTHTHHVTHLTDEDWQTGVTPACGQGVHASNSTSTAS